MGGRQRHPPVEAPVTRPRPAGINWVTHNETMIPATNASNMAAPVGLSVLPTARMITAPMISPTTETPV